MKVKGLEKWGDSLIENKLGRWGYFSWIYH